MSYMTEFPDYDGELYTPEGFKDYSWHNDVCPHVAKRYDSKDLEIEVCIWQDYVNPELREGFVDYENISKRYGFIIEINHGSVFTCTTDSLEKIKELVEYFNNSEWAHDMK